MITIAITGGKDFNDRKFIWKCLDYLHKKSTICFMIVGDAKGTDFHALEWAKSRKIPYKRFEADWDMHGKPAGAIRNTAMVAYGLENGIDGLVAFPGGRGTLNMKNQCKYKQIKIWEPEYKGERND